jgi:hypothetical protein
LIRPKKAAGSKSKESKRTQTSSQQQHQSQKKPKLKLKRKIIRQNLNAQTDIYIPGRHKCNCQGNIFVDNFYLFFSFNHTHDGH